MVVDMSMKRGFFDICSMRACGESSMSWDPQSPYNELPPLPPAVDIESKAILKACIGARAALAELRAAAKTIPNEAVLINAIPLLEARASSAIENIVTTTDELFRQAQLDETSADPATKEALRYRTALRDGFERLKERPLTTNTAIEICRTITGASISIRSTPGVALRNTKTGEIVYTPPEGEALLREKLHNWERFIHEYDSVDPLIRMAIQHYQFEAIHPFGDGNGRTGRVINVLFLIDQDLLDLPILYLSKEILDNRTAYYQKLLAVTRAKAWEDWIVFILQLTEITSKGTLAKIVAIKELMDHMSALVRERAARIYSKDLIEALFVQPYCRISTLSEMGVAKRQTASLYLSRLVELSILTELKAGREKLFINHKMVNLLKGDCNVLLQCSNTIHPSSGEVRT